MDERAGHHRKMRSRRWLPVALWFAVVASIVLLADTRVIPGFFEWVGTAPGLDKAGHFVLMGGLAWCANFALAWRRVRIGRFSVRLGSLLVAIIVVLEEASQWWIPNRTCDAFDLMADACGIWLAGRIAVHG